jgi:hypothetical protein
MGGYPLPEPQKKSRVLFWVLGCLGLSVLGGIIVVFAFGGLIFAFLSAGANSDAYKAAQEYVKKNSAAKAELGDIQEFSSYPSFEFNTGAGGTIARFDFHVKGTKGEGDVTANVTGADTSWTVSSATLTTSTGKKVSL